MASEEGFFASFDAPVVVVTATGDGESSGCLVGFATQTSIHPPRFLVCLSVLNHTFEVAARATTLGVHVLGADQLDLASLFGEDTGDEVDKLSQVPTHTGLAGTPMLLDCAAWFEGNILERVPFGDHLGFLLEPIDAGMGNRPGILRRSEASHLEPGHPADEIL